LARHSVILGTFEKALTHLHIESLDWKEFLEKRRQFVCEMKEKGARINS
jgi:hypothetical protein